MFVLAVVGSKSSGKTTVIESLVRELTKRGYEVATVKHIPEEDFTIDSEGKDTWRHAKAGAKEIISVAPKELAIIHKTEKDSLSLDMILQNCKDKDIILLEGFTSLVGNNLEIPKIVTIKSFEEALEALKALKPIVAFSGAAASTLTKKRLGIPVVDALNEPEKLTDLIEEKIKEAARMDEGFSLYVDDTRVKLNPFIQRMIKSVVLAIASNLKGVEIPDKCKVFVKISKE